MKVSNGIEGDKDDGVQDEFEIWGLMGMFGLYLLQRQQQRHLGSL